jgi:4-amino-4-deoxy-L-arabinose transferase-like glycosyltransferase
MKTLINCSLWGDEAFSAVLAQREFWPMIQIVAKDTSPPLMYIIMWGWFKIFGSSELSIRSLSFLFYLGTCALVYLIAKKLYTKRAGIIAAFLTFFNPFLFFYAFEGRMYFTLLFFIVLSYYFLLTRKRWGFILAAAAALYSHHFAILAIASQFFAQILMLFITKQKGTTSELIKLIKTYLLVGVLYLPWVYPLYMQTKLVSTGFWLGKPKLENLFDLIKNLIKEGGYKKVIEDKILPLYLIILGLRKWSKKVWQADLHLIIWALLPPTLAFLISQTSISIFYERYLLFCVPPLMILAASRFRKISLPFIGILLIVYAFIGYYSFTNPFKKPFKEFSGWIKQNYPDTYLINYNGNSHHLWETKYYGLKAPIYSPGGKLPFFVGTAQMGDEDVIYELGEEQIGVITSNHPDDVNITGYSQNFVYNDDPLYFLLMEKNNDEKNN